MKTTHPAGLPVSASVSVRRLLPVVAIFCCSMVFAAESPSGVAEPKTHTLFMGTDFSIEQNKELYRVRDIVGGSFVINVNGKEVMVPMDRGLSKMKVEPGLKLTESSATVANLKGERAYTTANDPSVQLQRGMARSQLQYSDSLNAQHQANAGFTALSPTTAVLAHSPASPQATVDPSRALVTSINQSNAQLNLQNIAQGPGSNYNTDGLKSGEGAYDAMNVDFDISSEKPLNRPYLVIMVQYHAAGSKPGQVANWIYARALDPINHEAKKVHVEQGGFPPGFELQDFQVHLYNQGEEIATTVAPKRVALTRDEAFQYVVMEYVGAHKGATLPATPAMGRLPADLPARLANGQLKQTYYVKVAKDGKASAAFSDEACLQKVDDPYVQSVVSNLRFKPALDKGKPVEGVTALNLSRLPI
jgi:hypothetical protein